MDLRYLTQSMIVNSSGHIATKTVHDHGIGTVTDASYPHGMMDPMYCAHSLLLSSRPAIAQASAIQWFTFRSHTVRLPGLVVTARRLIQRTIPFRGSGRG